MSWMFGIFSSNTSSPFFLHPSSLITLSPGKKAKKRLLNFPFSFFSCKSRNIPLSFVYIFFSRARVVRRAVVDVNFSSFLSLSCCLFSSRETFPITFLSSSFFLPFQYVDTIRVCEDGGERTERLGWVGVKGGGGTLFYIYKAKRYI